MRRRREVRYINPGPFVVAEHMLVRGKDGNRTQYYPFQKHAAMLGAFGMVRL